MPEATGLETGSVPAHPGLTTPPRFGPRLYAFDTSSVVHLRSSLCHLSDPVLPGPFPFVLTTVAFDHRRRRRFETCSCQLVPRGLSLLPHQLFSCAQSHLIGPLCTRGAQSLANRLRFLDAKIYTTTRPPGCVSFPWICAGEDHSRGLRQSSGPSREPVRGELIIFAWAAVFRLVRPKNSAETRWSIEPQGLLKDSPLCDDATPIAAYRGRRLDEPTPAGCDRIPPGRESHTPGTTRWQTQALHRRPAHSAGAQSQARRPTPPGEISHPRHSRYPAPLVSCPDRQKVDLSQGQSPRSTTRRCDAGKTRGQTAPRKSNLGQQAHRGSLGQSRIQVE